MRGVRFRILDAEEPRVDRPLTDGDEGLVAVDSLSMCSRYQDDPTPSLRDGLQLSGDLGRLDAHGAQTLTGRAHLIVNMVGKVRRDLLRSRNRVAFSGR